jgi:2-keto-3-deoxy-L-rhamnonate aldolase RhmA
MIAPRPTEEIVMRTNPVKAALKEGKIVYGSEVSRLRSPEVPRLYAAADFDFVFIDMEHSAFSLETVADLVLAARAADIVPLVRVPQAEYVWVARVLDLGAQGVIVPRVNTARQAADVVSWMRYPPLGIRGFACTAAQTDHRPVAPDAFMEASHRETLCVIQVERQEAVDNLDEMLSVPGVDVACLGYMDLSVDLGVPGQLEHPTMVQAVERLIAAADAHGVAPGIICPRLDAVARWMAAGMRFVSYATEFLLLQEAATAAARRLRGVERELPVEGVTRASV